MTSLPSISLVTGGAASGKSDFAETLVRASSRPRFYIATAQAFDTEMEAKIEAHKEARAEDGWTTFEEPLDLAGALPELPEGGVALLDCVTMWLSNLMMQNADLEREAELLIASLDALPYPLVIVTNEVGQGVVPDNALARRFRQAQGQLNRLLAARADLVVQVTAGLPLVLKGALPETLQ
ncbi:MAG: bifunctional adenosylcobinamide kinase/adenosylcobinamide-phosphate guanylyltransferase [Pseudomonadota bacterium]